MSMTNLKIKVAGRQARHPSLAALLPAILDRILKGEL